MVTRHSDALKSTQRGTALLCWGHQEAECQGREAVDEGEGRGGGSQQDKSKRDPIQGHAPSCQGPLPEGSIISHQYHWQSDLPLSPAPSPSCAHDVIRMRQQFFFLPDGNLLYLSQGRSDLGGLSLTQPPLRGSVGLHWPLNRGPTSLPDTLPSQVPSPALCVLYSTVCPRTH